MCVCLANSTPVPSTWYWPHIGFTSRHFICSFTPAYDDLPLSLLLRRIRTKAAFHCLTSVANSGTTLAQQCRGFRLFKSAFYKFYRKWNPLSTLLYFLVCMFTWNRIRIPFYLTVLLTNITGLLLEKIVLKIMWNLWQFL